MLLLVNGMGGTPLMELYLMYDARCGSAGARVDRGAELVGNYCTSLEMAGVSVSLTRLDTEMIALWDAPVRTAALRWGT